MRGEPTSGLPSAVGGRRSAFGGRRLVFNVWALAALAALVICASQAHAQTVEITPFAGYRAGGDFFEIATGQPIDADGAPSVGALVNVGLRSLSEGLKVEALFSHQDARVDVRASLFEPPQRVRVTVQHIQVGGTQDFGRGRVRPFLSGLLGVTRYATSLDSEVRFSMGSGGGVKVFATPNLGLRLDGRLYVTFVDVDVSGTCGGLGCILGFDTSAVWQGEATAGVIVAF